MTIKAILQVEPGMDSTYPVLRQKSKQVTSFGPDLQDLIQDLLDTMRHVGGVGLAAPQIGIPLAVAVIEIEGQVTIIVNPEIKKIREEYEPTEACLSVPGYYGFTTRGKRVNVKARDRRGKKFGMRAEGLLAKALQHEIDHLNGILYLDRLKSPDRLMKEQAELGDTN